MGVTGLWKLIEPSGKPVPLETLENKVLAVDISIWIHQAIKGFQDSRGASVPNAHLLGLFNRLCKLLYYRVKPVFVFDGGIPNLKKETIAKRNQQKNKYINESERIQQQLLRTLAKHKAVKHLLKEKVKNVSPKKSSPEKIFDKANQEEDLFKLPPIVSQDTPEELSDSSSGSSSENKSWTDLHTVDVESKDFKSLPLEMRHDILTDLKESRKQSSWGRLHELPEESDDFSSYQMRRLRKRRAVQVSLDEVEKEMGGHTLSMSDLEKILTDEGILAAESSSSSKRIVGDNTKKYLYIKDLNEALKQAMSNIKNNEHSPSKLPRIEEVSSDEEIKNDEIKSVVKTLNDANNICSSNGQESDKHRIFIDESFPSTSTDNMIKEDLGDEFDEELEAAIKLSLQDEDHTFEETLVIEDNEKQLESNHMALARAYMMENTDLTQEEIHKIITRDCAKNSRKHKKEEPLTNKEVIVPIVVSETKNDEPIQQNKESNLLIHDIQNIDDIAPSTEMISKTNNTNKIVELECSQEISSDSDEDFIEVTPDMEYDKPQNAKASITVLESIQSISSDSDTELKEVSSKVNHPIEIHIDKDKLNVEVDDMFSDIFANTKSENDIMKQIKERNVSEDVAEITTVDLISEIRKNTPEKLDNIQIESKDIQTDPNVMKENEDVTENNIEIINLENETASIPNTEITPMISKATEQDLQEMSTELQHKAYELLTERSKQDRLGNTITEQMTKEIQELLQLFGIPYIIAPMEAEAQCAFLNDIKLTDGTITDDSDIWLFGGKTVYKNFFNQRKYVMEFKLENIYNHFKLSREQLIQFALLVGSDYTTGIQSIGAVTALEILAAFPSQDDVLSGLTNFKTWCQDGQPIGPGKTALKSKLKKIVLSEGFPSKNVVNAYLEPVVETSKETFRWGHPDLSILRDYTRTKFGWTTAKTEDILKPIIAKLNVTQTQRSIKDFFHVRDFKVGSVDKLSKRVQLAVNKLSGKDDEADKEIQLTNNLPKNIKKQRDSQKNTKVTKAKSNLKGQNSNKRTIKTVVNKDVIPQKEKEKSNFMKNKMKAIEIFRKSKKGPGFVEKRNLSKNELIGDANLSESSDE